MKLLKILKKRKRYQLKILIGFMEAISSSLMLANTKLRRGENYEECKRWNLGWT